MAELEAFEEETRVEASLAQFRVASGRCVLCTRAVTTAVCGLESEWTPAAARLSRVRRVAENVANACERLERLQRNFVGADDTLRDTLREPLPLPDDMAMRAAYEAAARRCTERPRIVQVLLFCLVVVVVVVVGKKFEERGRREKGAVVAKKSEKSEKNTHTHTHTQARWRGGGSRRRRRPWRRLRTSCGAWTPCWTPRALDSRASCSRWRARASSLTMHMFQR